MLLATMLIFNSCNNGNSALENYDFIDYHLQEVKAGSTNYKVDNHVCSDPANMELPRKLAKKINTVLSETEKHLFEDSYTSETKAFNWLAEITLPRELSLADDINIKFRGSSDYSYILTIHTENSGLISLAEKKNGKKKILKQSTINTTYFLDNPWEPREIKIIIEDNHLLIFEHKRLIMLYDKLAGSKSRIHIKGERSKESTVSLYYKITGVDNTGKKIISDDIVETIKNYHWNSFYPRQAISDIEGTNHLQRVSRKDLTLGYKLLNSGTDYEWIIRTHEGRLDLYDVFQEQIIDISPDVTLRSLLLQSGKEVNWETAIPENSRLEFNFSYLRRHLYDVNDHALVVTIDNGKTSEEWRFSLSENEYLTKRWVSETINLKEKAGEKCTIRFRFDYSGNNKDFKDKFICLLANPVILPIREEAEKNVILISLDTLRYDHLGCYGYREDISPNINTFAGNSFVFEEAVSSASHTLPSHRAIFTGHYPTEGGYYFPDHKKNLHSFSSFHPSLMTITDYMRNNRIFTVNINGGGYVSAPYGFDRGFQWFQNSSMNIKDAGLDISAAVNWIKNHRDVHFFMFLHTYEIHAPYNRNYYLNTLNPSGETEKIIARYDSGIRYTDEKLGHLFKKLKELKLFDNTLIIITSDHGERFDMTEEEKIIHSNCGIHGFTVYEPEIRVPLIIGGALKADNSKRISNQVRSIDILPTILDYLDIELTHPVRGRSLLPLMEGKELKKLPAFSEAIDLQYKPNKMIRGLRYKNNKLIKNVILNKTNEEKLEFYDLKKDSKEKNNLYSVNNKTAVKYANILSGLLEEMIKNFNIYKTLGGSDNIIDEALLKQLKELGYIN